MSAQQFNGGGGGGGGGSKKAVHVKWAGKTIALGTFPASEADEKCARAKALTRAWRSTMRPKPSRDWVMLELERLGVRVVSGRLGRKAGEDGDDSPAPDKKPGPSGGQGGPIPGVGGDVGLNGGVGGMGGPPVERSNSIGWGADADLNNLMARRNSSLGLSMMNDTAARRGSLSSLGQMVGLDSVDSAIPPHRPYVGGGAAAAYEASRHDHNIQKAEQQRRASSLGLGTLAGGGLSNMGVASNANQHYEMLKLHHMNLLNEIQETTLMMNLYQQQQLQQQQQQLQQQANSEQIGGNDPQMAMLLQQNSNQSQGLDQMFGSGQLNQQQRASLGLGGPQMNGGGGILGSEQMQMLQQQQQQQQQRQQGQAGQSLSQQQQQQQQQLQQQHMNKIQMNGIRSNGGSGGLSRGSSDDELESRLAQLKNDIARRDAEKLGSSGPGGHGRLLGTIGNKRSADDDQDGQLNKRIKIENPGGNDNGDDSNDAD